MAVTGCSVVMWLLSCGSGSWNWHGPVMGVVVECSWHMCWWLQWYILPCNSMMQLIGVKAWEVIVPLIYPPGSAGLRKRASWPQFNSHSGLALCLLLWFLFVLFSGDEVAADLFHVYWLWRSPWVLFSPIMEDFSQDGKCGPMGCPLMLSRRSSIDFPAIWDVDTAFLIVFFLMDISDLIFFSIGSDVFDEILYRNCLLLGGTLHCCGGRNQLLGPARGLLEYLWVTLVQWLVWLCALYILYILCDVSIHSLPVDSIPC